MSSLFDLSRLPFVALTIVFNTMDFEELYNLTKCSKKTANKIKSVSTRKTVALYFGSSNYVYVYDQGNNGFCFIIKSSYNIPKNQTYSSRSFGSGEKKVTVPVESKHENSLISYWEDDIIAFKTIVAHLMEIFKVSIESFHCYRDISVENFQSFIGDIMERQGEIKKLDLGLEKLTDNDFKSILDTVNVTEKLVIRTKPSLDFEYSFKRFPKIMSISNSYWITLKNLLSFNSCQVITLYGSNLTNQDMDVFMESWKAGSFPKLEMLHVQGKNFNVQEPVTDIFVGIDNPDGEDKMKIIGDKQLRIHAGWNIERNDGTIAIIKLEKLYGLSTFEHLQMIVWL